MEVAASKNRRQVDDTSPRRTKQGATTCSSISSAVHTRSLLSGVPVVLSCDCLACRGPTKTNSTVLQWETFSGELTHPSPSKNKPWASGELENCPRSRDSQRFQARHPRLLRLLDFAQECRKRNLGENPMDRLLVVSEITQQCHAVLKQYVHTSSINSLLVECYSYEYRAQKRRRTPTPNAMLANTSGRTDDRTIEESLAWQQQAQAFPPT